MPYGISTYGQSAQIDSPLQHTGALIPQHLGTTTIYAGSESNNGSPSAVSSTALQTTSQAVATSSIFRNEDKRLTREAMEKYLRNRNDMIIVILHAKVITHFCHTHESTKKIIIIML
jgi:hypothetical protein